ncbi:hypothetical protein F1559_000009 [Cyanidiococcus yangmingshanensis]|uniref:Uncharacterized protein n=1 Tax=Cyanidiococcus yangmingshanensis TaxID=2690220 RepID=A0A7J7IFG6_9RHOD|nr:hypothetical protein F1559_000009 [Cyanidiococcus yangmingshanensis]
MPQTESHDVQYVGEGDHLLTAMDIETTMLEARCARLSSMEAAAASTALASAMTRQATASTAKRIWRCSYRLTVSAMDDRPGVGLWITLTASASSISGFWGSALSGHDWHRPATAGA